MENLQTMIDGIKATKAHTRHEAKVLAAINQANAFKAANGGSVTCLATFRIPAPQPCQCCGHTHMQNVTEVLTADGGIFWVGPVCAGRLLAA